MTLAPDKSTMPATASPAIRRPSKPLPRERAEALSYDHRRLTDAAGGGATVRVSPVLPADIIGLYVLLPELT